ncbi:hypothetical protein PCANC_26869, partial [Puccinia coronata f. sp. avenae]
MADRLVTSASPATTSLTLSIAFAVSLGLHSTNFQQPTPYAYPLKSALQLRIGPGYLGRETSSKTTGSYRNMASAGNAAHKTIM